MNDLLSMTREVLKRAGMKFDRLSVIELNRSSEKSMAVALLAFLDDQSAPGAFIKAVEDPARAVELEQEHTNLAYLRKHGDSGLCDSIPAPLFQGQVGGLSVLVESATPGTRMKNYPPDRYFNSRRFDAHLDQAVHWLVQLHQAGGDLPEDGINVTAAIREFREGYEVSSELDGLLDESAQILDSAQVPRTPLHGDFCTANVIISDDDRLFVVDWELPLTRSWPLADLLYFLSSVWCVPYRRGFEQRVTNFRTLFFEEHRHRARIRSLTARYAGDLGLAPELLLAVSVICWVTFANRKRAFFPLGLRETARAKLEGEFPLILIEDARCLNLELLARHRSRYVLN